MRHLGCRIDRLTYDYDKKAARFDLPPLNCTDMTGAIELAKRIDPDVKLIATYAGGEPDTVYRLRDDGWEALGHTGWRMAR